ncbi:DUF2637 domain-containing protein [Streptomyces sp. BR123]|uniref:DUF2637 domain-containing protein n=1 Tax=Streptomyces sp. BR123 TaxID=2749828 RepID=UPI0015C49A02|nr:DUF2637 domain-containing protein [Streptomyces sp. BR123]NXY98953.1 DUF2637 domain-containing protein [Streptomyces sp. BR123]
MAAMQLTRTHRILIGVVVAGAVVIAGIGFAGSYAAVRELALKKGFGSFSLVFPIGIDAGICVLLALDLLLTWIRIPFPLLRQTAWLLTAATIAFNGAAAWPDPLGVGMHAVIPILFVVTVEAARHAVGRIADITADRHMEGVRMTRWLLSPVPTFKLWRRMKLWELRSYEQAVGMEQDRLIYQARLQARYGRAWRRKAPVEALMPLRLARIGVPLSQTAPEGLAAAGIDPVLLPPVAAGTRAPALAAAEATAPVHGQAQGRAQEPAQESAAHGPGRAQAGDRPQTVPAQAPGPAPGQVAEQAPDRVAVQAPGGQVPVGDAAQIPMAKLHAHAAFAVDPTAMPAAHDSAWFAGPKAPQAAYEGGYNPQYVEGLEPIPVMAPAGPELPEGGQAAAVQQVLDGQQALAAQQALDVQRQARAAQRALDAQAQTAVQDTPDAQDALFPTPSVNGAEAGQDAEAEAIDEVKFEEAAYEVFRALTEEKNGFPEPEQVEAHLADRLGIGHPRGASILRRLVPELKQRYQRDLENEHIA